MSKSWPRPQQSETGDENRQTREQPEDLTKALLFRILLVEEFVKKEIVERIIRAEPVPDLLCSQCAGKETTITPI